MLDCRCSTVIGFPCHKERFMACGIDPFHRMQASRILNGQDNRCHLICLETAVDLRLYPPPYAVTERIRFSEGIHGVAISVTGTVVATGRAVGRGVGTGTPGSSGVCPGRPYSRMAMPSTTKIVTARPTITGRRRDGEGMSLYECDPGECDSLSAPSDASSSPPVSYTHLRAHET